MMHIFDSWMVWIGLGGVGTIGLIVLAFVAPSVLGIISELFKGAVSIAVPALKPAAAAIGRFLGKYISMLGRGALDTFDKGRRIAFVVTVCAVCYGVGGYFGSARAHDQAAAGDCKPTIDRLHKCFWFNPKKSAPAICRK